MLQKTLLVRLPQTGPPFRVALFEGIEPVALSRAVAARAGFSPDARFYCTAASHNCEGEAAGEAPVVPLSVALPDGLELLLHRCERRAGSRGVTVEKEGDTTPLSNEDVRMEMTPVNSTSTAGDHSAAIRSRSRKTATRRQLSDPSTRRRLSDSRGTLPEPSDQPSPRRRKPLTQRATLPEVSSDLLARRKPPNDDVLPEVEPARGFLHDMLRPLLSDEDSDSPERLPSPTGEPGLLADRGSVSEPESGSGWFPGLVQRWRTSRKPIDSGLFMPWQAVQQEKEDHMTAAVDAVERFSRLTSELANERTLLAWIRTSLAAIRTAFTYLSLTWAQRTWKESVITCEVTVAMLAVALAFTGWKRYSSIKAVLSRKVPPHTFGRISIKYINFLVVVATLITAVSISMQEWRAN